MIVYERSVLFDDIFVIRHFHYGNFIPNFLNASVGKLFQIKNLYRYNFTIIRLVNAGRLPDKTEAPAANHLIEPIIKMISREVTLRKQLCFNHF
jgi:hypothetical protein